MGRWTFLVWSGGMALGIWLTRFGLVSPLFLLFALCSLSVAMWAAGQFRSTPLLLAVSFLFFVTLGHLRVQESDWTLLSSGLQATVQEWGEALARRLDSMPFDHEVCSLLKAMLLGQRQDLDSSLRLLYNQVGASHVLALSGMHLGVLFWLLNAVFLRLLTRGWLRWGAGCANLLVMWLYVAVAGCPPSLVRAAVMMTVVQLGYMRQSGFFEWHAYGMAAFVILLFSPRTLFNVGFQLSFASVAGIFLFFKPLCQLFSNEHWAVAWLWRPLALTLSAQLGSFPLVAYYFHQVSLSSLVLSPVYVLFATFILFSGVGVLLLGSWVACVPAFFVGLQHGLMRLVTGWLSFLPTSVFLDEVQVVLLYMALLYMVPVVRLAVPRPEDVFHERRRRLLLAWPWWLTSALCLCLTAMEGALW